MTVIDTLAPSADLRPVDRRSHGGPDGRSPVPSFADALDAVERGTQGERDVGPRTGEHGDDAVGAGSTPERRDDVGAADHDPVDDGGDRTSYADERADASSDTTAAPDDGDDAADGTHERPDGPPGEHDDASPSSLPAAAAVGGTATPAPLDVDAGHATDDAAPATVGDVRPTRALVAPEMPTTETAVTAETGPIAPDLGAIEPTVSRGDPADTAPVTVEMATTPAAPARSGATLTPSETVDSLEAGVTESAPASATVAETDVEIADVGGHADGPSRAEQGPDPRVEAVPDGTGVDGADLPLDTGEADTAEGPTPTRTSQLAERISDRLALRDAFDRAERARGLSSDRIELDVATERFGALRIEATDGAEGLQLSLRSDGRSDPRALAALAEELRDELARDGIELADLDVGQRGPGDRSDDGSASRSDTVVRPGEETGGPTADSGPSHTTTPAVDRLDLRL